MVTFALRIMQSTSFPFTDKYCSEMNFSSAVEETIAMWSVISKDCSVPTSLFQHQIDTITLLLQGEHVFCSSPTGSGKTLAQLAAVLFKATGMI